MLVLVVAVISALVPGAHSASAAASTSDTIPLHSMGVRMPRVTVTVDEGASPGYVFITPTAKRGQASGPMILDSHGRTVWYERLPKTRDSVNLQAQTLNGEPVLTWAQRPPSDGPDRWWNDPYTTYNVIADRRYRITRRIRARGSGIYRTNLHAFVITKQNTALLMGYRKLPRDLTHWGGARSGVVEDNVIQEMDLSTGRILFSWSAARHVSPDDSLVDPKDEGRTFDFFHANSIDVDLDGNLLVSARHTSAIYKIDRHSGRVMWILGGRNSSFQMGTGTAFHYQHDAQRLPDGTITIFDNGATDWDKRVRASRVMRLRVDARTHRATLVRTYDHPAGKLSTSQGNARVLPDGNVFAGWGSSEWFSEHAPSGRLLFAAHMPSGDWQSYRAFKAPWTGRPTGSPAIAASRTRGGRAIVYASWNGALEIARWRVLAGPDRSRMQEVGGADWQNLETRIVAPAGGALVQAQALDADGNVLGTSPAVTPK